MKIKSGVIIQGLHASMRSALMKADKIMVQHGASLVVTSALDGTHSPGSLHPYGFAIDIRSKHLEQDNKADVLRQLQEQLPDFDVILECAGKDNEHFHIENEKAFYRYLNNFWGR